MALATPLDDSRARDNWVVSKISCWLPIKLKATKLNTAVTAALNTIFFIFINSLKPKQTKFFASQTVRFTKQQRDDRLFVVPPIIFHPKNIGLIWRKNSKTYSL